MPFFVQKISDHGASDPNFARLVLQTDDLVSVTTLSNIDREQLLDRCRRLAHRLVNAQEAARDIERRSNEEFETSKAKHVPDAQFIELPYLANLEIIFEGFFYNAKNIIRDIGGLTEILFA